MQWNWQQPDWPHFTWDAARLAGAEERFLHGSGILTGALRHFAPEELERLLVDSLSTEAVTTSEIEGEILDRASVQSSIRQQLGLETDKHRSRPAERGIAEMMVDLYRTFADPLSAEMLFRWHRMALRGRRDLSDVGRYRTQAEPMQVVSGPIGNRRVHFEAPASRDVPREMDRFIARFNSSSPTLVRAGVAHLYFVCIHPFEDGNGRIGRAISEKALAQRFGPSTLTGLAAGILARRKEYYAALEAANKSNEITPWLTWFAGIALEAQRDSIERVEFTIRKTRLVDRMRGHLNDRQQKALLRMLREGPAGFEGGLSAANYMAITGTSPATATRDLSDMVAKGALTRRGELRHARYYAALSA
jgi:Fic family protein